MKIAIIPARGGSKRIPHKNIKNFHGKPIIAWSVENALKSGLFDKVIVSTDDEEIADIAQKYKAEVPFIRPKNIADDYTGTNAVVKHALKWFESSGDLIEYACCIYATAPFVNKKMLIDGYTKLINLNKAFAFSVTSFDSPVQRALRVNRNGMIEAVWPENKEKRSQDFEEYYHDAGQFYWGKAEAFVNNVNLFSDESIPIILPRHFVQDIDTLDDWKRAELMFEVLVNSGEIKI